MKGQKSKRRGSFATIFMVVLVGCFIGLGALMNLYAETTVDGVDQESSASSGTVGPGTANTVAKFATTTTVGDSVITDDGTNVGIGTASPGAKFGVLGNITTTGTITSTGGLFATVLTAAQPNVTSVGTLTTLNVTGNTGIGTTSPGAALGINGDVSTTGNMQADTVTVGDGIKPGKISSEAGDVNIADSLSVSVDLTVMRNVTITGGLTISNVVSSSGAVYYAVINPTGGIERSSTYFNGGGGGAGTPGGNTTEVQFNDGGAFAGDTQFTFDKTANQLTTTGVNATGSPVINFTGGSAWISAPLTSSAQIQCDSTAVMNLSPSGNLNAPSVQIVQDASVGKDLTALGPVTISKSMTISECLSVSAAMRCGNSLTVSGNATIAQTLSAPGVVYFLTIDSNGQVGKSAIPFGDTSKL